MMHPSRDIPICSNPLAQSYKAEPTHVFAGSDVKRELEFILELNSPGEGSHGTNLVSLGQMMKTPVARKVEPLIERRAEIGRGA